MAGFPAALAAEFFGLCLVGALVGMLLGALLGIGPIAVLLLSSALSPDLSGTIALLGGLFFGAQYGRSISAILFGVPGGSTAIVTMRDGHPLAEQGQAGRALAVTLLASFVACTVATLTIAGLAFPLKGIALWLGPADYAAMLVLSLALAIAVAGGSPPKALVMVVLGLLLADVVARLNDSETQLPIGFNALKGSLNGYVVTIGLIVFSAAIGRLGATWSQATGSPPIPSVMPTWSDLRMPAGPVLRGSAIGTLIGLLPVGALVAPFLAYRIEQSLAKDAARFGSGAIEGVAAPEAANNAGAQAALLPMLTLGLQHNTVLAMLLGTLTISGATPGPQLQMASPEIFWGTIVAFWIGNLMVLAVGLSSVGAWVRLLRLPRRFVLGGLILLGCIWTYSINMSAVDPLLAVVLGFIGYGLAKRGFEPLPIVIGFLLGPQLEEFLSRALMISRGSLMPLLQRPLTTGLLLVAFLVLVMALLSWGREAKKPALTGR